MLREAQKETSDKTLNFSMNLKLKKTLNILDKHQLILYIQQSCSVKLTLKNIQRNPGMMHIGCIYQTFSLKLTFKNIKNIPE